MTYEPKHLTRWTLPDNYIGEMWPNYYSSGFGRSRNSDDLEESNFQTVVAALTALRGNQLPEDVHIVRESHWAVGWIEWIAIHQDEAAALQLCDKLREQYENYSALDEQDFCEREQRHADIIWRDCYSWKERVQYIRNTPYQFDFVNFTDMLSVVRGKYFAGYASDLIN